MAFAAVQRKGKAGTVASLSVGSADGWVTATAGNLIVVSANSNNVVTMSSAGYTAGPSVIDGNGTYLWYKVAAGTESTITLTPGSTDLIAMTACEYSGNTGTPFDASNSSTIAGSSGSTTTATSVTTTAAGDLIVAAALLHTPSGSLPTAPVWAASFVNQLSPSTGGSTAGDVYTFYGERVAGAAGAYSTSCSWTNVAFDRQQLIIAFKAAAGGTTVNGAAALTGAGTLTASSGGTTTAGAALTATATLTAGAQVRVPGSATLTAAGTFTATGVVRQLAAATLTGVGALTGSSGAASNGTASMTGAGSVTAAALVAVPGAASLAGSGLLTAAGSVRVLATAALAGSGSLTPAGVGIIRSTAVLAGVGSVTATAAVPGLVVVRPDTGTAARPSTGTITRPDTGVVVRP